MALALAMNSVLTPSWNPLRCGGTALPTPVLVIAKVLLLVAIRQRMWTYFPEPFLPFLSFFDVFAGSEPFRIILQTVFVIAAVLLLFNRSVRACCLIIAAVFFVAILSSRTYYQNNRVFMGCLFFVIGIQQQGQQPWLIRYQVALVYLGAGFNKLFDIDWRSGAFVETWMNNVLKKDFYARWSSAFPAMLLSKITGWAAIIGELSIGAGLTVRRLYPLAIWGGILFHTILLVLTESTYGMFYFAMLASYLAFVDWPTSPVLVLFDGDCSFCTKTKRFLSRFDLEGMFDWVAFQKADDLHGIPEESLRKKMYIVVGEKQYSGFTAFKMLTLFNPLTYFLFAAIATAPEPPGFEYRTWLMVAVTLFFSPLFTPVGEAAYSLVARNRNLIPGKQACDI